MLNSDYSYIIDPQFQWFYEFREFNPDIEIAGVFFYLTDFEREEKSSKFRWFASI